MFDRSLIILATVLIASTASPFQPSTAVAEVPTCRGVPATIVGTSGKDVLLGTGGPDVIWAGAGYDSVQGFGGDDVICMGEPDDVIPPPQNYDDGHTEESLRAGPGDDIVVGPPGYAYLAGGSGDDEIFTVGDQLDPRADGRGYWQQVVGGPGADTLHGRGVGDLLLGRGGPDLLLGGGGDDLLHGGRGDDALDAGAGDDLLRGSSGSDELLAGEGDDELWGDSPRNGFRDGHFGDDELSGGSGADELHGMGGVNSNDGGDGEDACHDPSVGARATSCE